ncbi:glycosyltransferase family 2 protein [Acinetobacter sp. ANC 7201]|uniref:glycosyltransferase family 2 protein n=1 Tax=Acinetobacter sp. ANC 7201 TaxID=3035288 RepID=UPI0027A90DE5|nr:glycosyltransferase family 2 protein [Acinetobacter sp. ANC 7201]WFP96569.1 glycosyltransferase family 2 protein [Acinetobacter sp. ANC 7201]
MKISAPLLSIIIPTHNRPQYLPRAVNSALGAAPNGDVEVIIVPNGGDETWRESLADLLLDKRIIVSPIEKGHANAARNHGLSLATGRYIRFLDDDDYFYADKACTQLECMISNNCNISFGYINKSQDDKVIETLGNSIDNDLIKFLISNDRITLPTGYIYSLSLINDVNWVENLDFMQDSKFIFDVIDSRKKIVLYVYPFPVGCWENHAGNRISRVRKYHERILIVYDFVSKFKDYPEYNLIWQDAIWNLIHQGLKVKFLYWISILFEFYKFYPNYVPKKKSYIFFRKITKKMIIFDLLLLPYRKLKYICVG